MKTNSYRKRLLLSTFLSHVYTSLVYGVHASINTRAYKQAFTVFALFNFLIFENKLLFALSNLLLFGFCHKNKDYIAF